MNKIEILKMAFEKSADAKEALAIAREIEEFLGEQPMQPMQPNNPKKKFWTKSEIEQLYGYYILELSIEEIAKYLGRSFNSVKAAIGRIDRGDKIGGKNDPRYQG